MGHSHLEFEHYTIRLLEIDDTNNYFNLVESNRKRLETFFVGTTSRTKTFQDTQEFVKDMVKRSEEKIYFPYIIIDNNNQKIIGFIDLKNIDWNIPKSEMGFYIDKEYAGKGVTSKALKLLCDFCFSEYKFEKLFLRTHPSNVSAIAVAKKCGFELEGTIRKEYKTTSGEIMDLHYFGRLK